MGQLSDWLRQRRFLLIAFLAIAALALAWAMLGRALGPAPEPTSTPLIAAATASAPDVFEERRLNMVRTQIRERGVSDETVLKAMEKVPRHRFVPEQYLDEAYADHPLPIGEGQTISQPYIVALMTDLLDLKPGERVLEIGTGSGYQAAVLAEIVDEVYTIEVIESLGKAAAARLEALGYTNIRTRLGDGYYGWEEHAPYDAIIVTAAPDHIPQPLVRQLKDGGRLVIPVGPPGAVQTLWRIEKKGDQIISRNEGAVRFVPLLRR